MTMALSRRPGLLGIALGLPLIIAAVAWHGFYGRWRIPQDGMYPTYPADSHLVARKNPYRSAADVRRGDVVIFRQDKDGVPYDYVWRVVGLPGERIAIRADAVFIDGRELPRRRISQADGVAILDESADDRVYRIALPIGASDGEGAFPELAVPNDHVFVLGDNRHHALDSRSMGPIPFGAILARVSW